MSRTEALRTVTKEYGGVVNLCKNIATTGESFVSEHELVGLITDFAEANKLASENRLQALSRIFSGDDEDAATMRKAVGIAKGTRLMVIEPRQIGGRDFDQVNDPAAAMRQLEELAQAQLERAPWLSTSQAFARAFDANPELAARAHQRPAPTTNYAFPK